MEGAGLEGVPRKLFPLRGNSNQAGPVANRFYCNIEGWIGHMFVLGRSIFW